MMAPNQNVLLTRPALHPSAMSFELVPTSTEKETLQNSVTSIINHAKALCSSAPLCELQESVVRVDTAFPHSSASMTWTQRPLSNLVG